MTAHPFDAAASTYDTLFTDRQLGRWLRAMVRNHLPFSTGDHVLELGSGTGEDAIWLAMQDIHVTATDAALNMLAITQQKAIDARLTNIQTQLLDLNAPQTLNTSFDGVLANFGVLNCVEDRPALADFLAAHLHTNARVVLVVMGPVCPWEILAHLVRADLSSASRRWRTDVKAHVGDGQTIPVWYPSPRRLIHEFSTHFRHVRTVGIGTLLPPSYMAHLVDRWPRTFTQFERIDRNLGHRFPFTLLNDHYLVEFARQ